MKERKKVHEEGEKSMLTSLVRAFGIDNAFTTEDDNHADLFKKDWSCR